jgi:hypothetical protein
LEKSDARGATQRMTSHLELFHAMREAIDVIREHSNAIEQAVARTQIYLDRDAMLDASTSLQDLQLATSGLQAMLDQCRNAERLHTGAGRTLRLAEGSPDPAAITPREPTEALGVSIGALLSGRPLAKRDYANVD